MTTLILGGAGYIGSHMAHFLRAKQLPCVVLDNLSTGFKQSVPDVPFYEGDVADQGLLQQIIKQHAVTSVMHFAAFSQVGESVLQPSKYFSNNLANTLPLLEVMQKQHVTQLVFSSTAAVYGHPTQTLIDEQHPVNPINPYGHSKMAVEWALHDYAKAYGLQAVSLRYFNAAGAQPDGSNGERHDPETHLIPLVLQTASKRRKVINIFGNDYATPDGTCVRDYIHIVDLAQAHWLALLWLEKQSHGVYKAFNLGNGAGYSVREVIDTAKRVTQLPIPEVIVERRPGDPATLVASAQEAQAVLGWQPQYNELATIIKHAWQWEQKVAGQLDSRA